MFVRVCADYADFISGLRDRAVEMKISREDIDEVAGLCDGYAGKLLSTQPRKILGPISMGPTLGALGLRLMLVEDTAAAARTIARRVPVDASNQRFGNRSNSKVVESLPPPAPIESEHRPPRLEPVTHSHLRVVQSRDKGSARWGGVL